MIHHLFSSHLLCCSSAFFLPGYLFCHHLNLVFFFFLTLVILQSSKILSPGCQYFHRPNTGIPNKIFTFALGKLHFRPDCYNNHSNGYFKVNFTTILPLLSFFSSTTLVSLFLLFWSYLTLILPFLGLHADSLCRYFLYSFKMSSLNQFKSEFFALTQALQ